MDSDKTVIGGNTAPGAAHLINGSDLGDYRVIRHLGSGAMGQVYEVEQVRLGRRYALKVLPAELGGDPAFLKRFEQEARTLAGLDHAGIVQVVYAGDARVGGVEHSYLVMELLRPFAEWRKERGVLDEAVVRGILEQVLSALDYAHRRGIIHRDLKPANLLVVPSSTDQSIPVVKIGDFGVARVVGDEFLKTVVDRTIAATRLGNAVTQIGQGSGGRSHGEGSSSSDYAGTVHYMAPEVLGGLAATARSDLYAIGVMAYEWLTGRMPIGRAKAVADLRRDVSKGWDDWIDRLLEYDPAERFADSGECLQALAGVFEEPNVADIPEVKVQVRQGDPVVTVDAPPVATSHTGGCEPPVAGNVCQLHLSAYCVLAMVWIPPGEFVMGSLEQIRQGGMFNNEGPPTQVHLTKGYWLGRSPVTQGQWQSLMDNNPSHFKQSGLNAPVESVSWDETMGFCRKLTERERSAGRLPAGYQYTLPSEAQWEYASRAGTTTHWSFGDDASRLGDYAWFDGNSGGQTHPVGQKNSNTWGLHDVHGNVWEWTRSWSGNYPGGIVENCEGPGSGLYRDFRGGSWSNAAVNTRSAYRHRDTPFYRHYNLGFRLALTPSP